MSSGQLAARAALAQSRGGGWGGCRAAGRRDEWRAGTHPATMSTKIIIMGALEKCLKKQIEGRGTPCSHRCGCQVMG